MCDPRQARDDHAKGFAVGAAHPRADLRRRRVLTARARRRLSSPTAWPAPRTRATSRAYLTATECIRNARARPAAYSARRRFRRRPPSRRAPHSQNTLATCNLTLNLNYIVYHHNAHLHTTNTQLIDNAPFQYDIQRARHTRTRGVTSTPDDVDVTSSPVALRDACATPTTTRDADLAATATRDAVRIDVFIRPFVRARSTARACGKGAGRECRSGAREASSRARSRAHQARRFSP